MADLPIAGPGHDPWTVALFAAADPRVVVGCGVLIDRRRVLTCWHVVEGKGALIATFPKAGVSRQVRRLIVDVRGNADSDVAILELDELAPPEATPAPLRSPLPRALHGDQWWAFGFPRDSPLGAEAHGRVGGPLAYGWVRSGNPIAVRGEARLQRRRPVVAGLQRRGRPGRAGPAPAARTPATPRR